MTATRHLFFALATMLLLVPDAFGFTLILGSRPEGMTGIEPQVRVDGEEIAPHKVSGVDQYQIDPSTKLMFAIEASASLNNYEGGAHQFDLPYFWVATHAVGSAVVDAELSTSSAATLSDFLRPPMRIPDDLATLLGLHQQARQLWQSQARRNTVSEPDLLLVYRLLLYTRALVERHNLDPGPIERNAMTWLAAALSQPQLFSRSTAPSVDAEKLLTFLRGRDYHVLSKAMQGIDLDLQDADPAIRSRGCIAAENAYTFLRELEPRAENNPDPDRALYRKALNIHANCIQRQLEDAVASGDLTGGSASQAANNLLARTVGHGASVKAATDFGTDLAALQAYVANLASKE